MVRGQTGREHNARLQLLRAGEEGEETAPWPHDGLLSRIDDTPSGRPGGPQLFLPPR